jgi:hypothetical protein
MAADPDAHSVRRLAIIKHLYSRAVEQSRQGPPMAGLAILGMHDAAEMFLLLACEVNERGLPTGHPRLPKKPVWGDYWTYLDPLRPEERNAMNRLNEARAALKHRGLMPSPQDVESLRVTCQTFFQDNTPILFGLSLDSISMVDLVRNGETQKFVRKAIQMRDLPHPGQAVTNAAIAFWRLLEEYGRRRDTPIGQVLFELGGSCCASGYDVPDDVGAAIDELGSEIDHVRDALKMVALGIDFRRWARFHALTPTILRGEPLQSRHAESRLLRRPPPTKEDAEFCIEFTVESALRLQDHE